MDEVWHFHCTGFPPDWCLKVRRGKGVVLRVFLISLYFLNHLNCFLFSFFTSPFLLLSFLTSPSPSLLLACYVCFCLNFFCLFIFVYFGFISFSFLLITVSKELKDDGGSDILKYLRLIITGAVMGLLAIIIPSIWIYCLCCRKKAKMTLPERDQFQKEKWQRLNAYQRI